MSTTTLKTFRVFRNHYLCPDCPNEWSDEASVVGPSFCPACDAEAEPYDYEALLEETDEEDAMDVRMQFIDRHGRDVTGTEEVDGYRFQDYFTSNIEATLTEACGDRTTANEWLRSAYLGPDSDGIGVRWEME